jgi:putative endonuclease
MRARQLLERKGLRFVEANWRCREGEIDLVMRDRDELVFVEVKLRRGERFGSAAESVTSAKARKLLIAGASYVAAHPELEESIWRIDTVALTLSPSGQLVDALHIENAVIAG